MFTFFIENPFFLIILNSKLRNTNYIISNKYKKRNNMKKKNCIAVEKY